MSSDVTADYLALRRDVGAVDLPRDVIRVSGPQAVQWLHDLLSQNVSGLSVGASALSLVLQPQGKLVALVRVTRVADDAVVVDTDTGWGAKVADHLARFKLRTKADVERLDWRCVALRGPRAHDAVPGPSGEGPVVAAADWPGLPGVDLLGPDPEPPKDVRRCSTDAYEAVRIEAGVPVMGREADEGTMPHELGIVDRAVDMAKGCYVGQELVARVDARGGHSPRFLRGVVVARNVVPPVGATVREPGGGPDRGRVTSVAESLDRHAPVGLAIVQRALEPPADVELAWEGGTAPARLESLPLVS